MGVKSGKISPEEAKKDEKKVEKATAAKKKKKAAAVSLVQTVKDNSQQFEEVVKKKSRAAKKKAKDAKVKAVDSGEISAEEAKADEKKVDKATAAKKKKKAPAADLIDIPDDDGILSLVQASQGMFLDSDNICVIAKKGDMAPINGQFNGREVATGSVAMETGSFCVDHRVLALVQRSWGLSSAEEVEEVVKKKSKAD